MADPVPPAALPPAAGPPLATRAARGAFVTVGGQGLKIVVQVLSVVILARLLSPHDYGLLAMITAVIGIADIFRDFGLSSAAIQAPVLTDAQRDNLFWLNTALGLVLAVIVFLSAPLLAWVYHEPALTSMTHVLAGTFLLNGLATQYRAHLNRHLLFFRLTLADVLSPLLALGVAAVLALRGAGYWALVAQQLVQVAVMMAIVVLASRWAPRWWHRDAGMRPFLNFGWPLAGSQIITYIGSNTDSLVIGTRFGAGPLGLYNRAFQLLMTPLGQLRAPMSTVAIPVLSKLQDDEKRFGSYLKLGQVAMGYTIVAGLGLVIGGVRPVIEVFLGEQWRSVAWILRCLAVAGVFQTLAYVGYWVYISQGLVKDLFRYSIASTAIRVTCILVGSVWGVDGVAAGFAVAPALSWTLSFWWLSRCATIPLRDLITNGLRILGFTAVVALAAYAAASWTHAGPAALGLLAVVVSGLLVFGLGALLVPAVRRDLVELRAAVRQGTRRAGRPGPGAGVVAEPPAQDPGPAGGP